MPERFETAPNQGEERSRILDTSERQDPDAIKPEEIPPEHATRIVQRDVGQFAADPAGAPDDSENLPEHARPKVA